MPEDRPLETALRQTLKHLYDPAQLRSSALIGLLGLEGSSPEQQLLKILRQGIESQRPPDDAPADCRERRRYLVLQYRFLDQMTQAAAAARLGMTTRHLRREQTAAIAAIAHHLRLLYGIPSIDGAHEPVWAEESAYSPEIGPEMDRLAASLGNQTAEPLSVIEESVALARPLAAQHRVRVTYRQVGASLPPVAIPAAILKQVLLNLVAAGCELANGTAEGTLQIVARGEQTRVVIDLAAPSSTWVHKNVEFSKQMLHAFQGDLRVERRMSRLVLSLPRADQVLVLAVEDSQDTLELWQRYLTDTQFRLIGTANPQEALRQAADLQPDLILLDVMMPGTDGWELLCQLKRSPQTARIPVLVCTVLPQEALALSLGASGFIRKPVMGQAFRAELERQIAAAGPA